MKKKDIVFGVVLIGAPENKEFSCTSCVCAGRPFMQGEEPEINLKALGIGETTSHLPNLGKLY